MPDLNELSLMSSSTSLISNNRSVYWWLILIALDHTPTFSNQKSRNFKLKNTKVYITIQLHNNWVASTFLFQTDFSPGKHKPKQSSPQ